MHIEIFEKTGWYINGVFPTDEILVFFVYVFLKHVIEFSKYNFQEIKAMN